MKESFWLLWQKSHKWYIVQRSCFPFLVFCLTATIHLWLYASLYMSVLMQKHTEIIHTVFDYQWKLYLCLRILIILKAFYCRVEDYILTINALEKNSFYCSLSAILMFADSISRIMVRLLFSTALECVAFFCTEVQKLLSNFFRLWAKQFCFAVVRKVNVWQSSSWQLII